MRYFIRFAYCGSGYHGWQRQPNALTVQEVVEGALSTLLKNPIAVVAAGRTDAGVHAKEMYAHFDAQSIDDEHDLVNRLNRFLPERIAVYQLFAMKDGAHARFDALQRTYEYWIVQHKNPFLNESAHFIWTPLQFETMNQAAGIMMEYQDFECFSKSNTDVKTFLCDIKEAVWAAQEDKWVFTITADRFLRNMVRAIVGTLLNVGLGHMKPEGMRKIIESKDRSQAGVSVPAKGLYLTKVAYPKNIFA